VSYEAIFIENKKFAAAVSTSIPYRLATTCCIDVL